MVDYHYPTAAFVGDATALDFVNSIATTTSNFDWMSDGKRLLDWLEQAKLVPRDELNRVRKRVTEDDLDSIAEQARHLRKWFRAFVENRMGRALPHCVVTELGPLNRLLENGVSYNQFIEVSNEDRGFELRAIRHWNTPASLLLPIGEAIARFVCEEDFANVKVCEGLNCSLLFADHTRRRGRRWCSMAVCGNRAKVQAHRDRAKQANISIGQPA